MRSSGRSSSRTDLPSVSSRVEFYSVECDANASASKWQGKPIDAKALAEKQGERTSALASHLVSLTDDFCVCNALNPPR